MIDGIRSEETKSEKRVERGRTTKKKVDYTHDDLVRMPSLVFACLLPFAETRRTEIDFLAA